MFRPDDDRHAGTVDVLVQQAYEPLFFLDHLHERLQRLQRQPLMSFDERRRAFDVDLLVVGQIGKGRGGEPHGAREQRVVEQPLLVDALEHRFARPVERQAGEFRVQIIRRLREGRPPEAIR